MTFQSKTSFFVLGLWVAAADVDIVTKVWNKDGAAYHLDYWRNDVVQADRMTPPK